MRLLPENQQLGYTPYLYLVYLSIFVAWPFFDSARSSAWPLMLIGLAVFLVLYFRAYWIGGGPGMWLPVLGITALGVIYMPQTMGGSTFYIFAAAFSSRIGSRRLAMLCLAGLVGIVLLETWWFELPPWVWLPAAVWVPIIGLMTQHETAVQAKNQQLRQSQEKISQLARSAERERIGRDLHDLLGHTLSVITLKAELAARLAERDPTRAAQEMREVESVSRDALKQVRTAVLGYRGTNLEQELDNAHRALATANVELHIEGQPPALDPPREQVLALAVREAVTNVIRHARARHCQFAWGNDPAAVRLEIGDDGVGGASREGSGLSGMRERLEQLGGTLARHTKGGTQLVISLPLTIEQSTSTTR